MLPPSLPAIIPCITACVTERLRSPYDMPPSITNS